MAVPWPEIAAHRERLVRLARRRVPTLEDAEDVASEAMLRCATFEQLDEARLAQFLTAITIRLCADVHREADRGTRLVRRLDLDDAPSPEELACAAADAGMLRDLLERLPDSQRAVLVDRAHGLSVTQISTRHSLTYKAVESALSRARATMRTAIASALAMAFGMAEALRRRPAIETALPAAGVVLVTAVMAPFVLHGRGPDTSAQPGLPALVRPTTAPTSFATPAPRPTPLVRPTPDPTAFLPAATVAAVPKPKPTGTPFEVEFDDEPIVRDNDGRLFTREDFENCLRYGPQVHHPGIDPSRPVPSPGSTVNVDCTP